MPPEYVTREEYEKIRAEIRAEYTEEIFKIRKAIQEQKARDEEREKQREKLIEERGKMISRLWTERIVYISILIGSISILTTIIVTKIW